MAPRTRRTASQKQKHSDIEEKYVTTTPPSKKKFGGVLASLSNNVPAVKTNNSKGEYETLESGNNESSLPVLKTPQLPRSVIVGKDDGHICSPLTQPRIPKSSRGKHHATPDKSFEDSIVSNETFSPLPKGRLARKTRVVIEDDESSSEEEQDDDDDKTLEMDEDDMEADPNETILESEASDEEEEEEESEVESEEDYESEAEEEFDESDDCEPDDDTDEYVPEEEEDSVSSDEDLDDYVEEEKETTKPSSRKRQAKAKLSKPASPESIPTSNLADDIAESVDIPTSNFADDRAESVESNVAKDIETDSIHECAADDTTQVSIDECAADDTTQVEQTPAKLRMTSHQNMCFDSPECETAVVVDDDDFEDDDDILVATILADEDEEPEEQNEAIDLSAAKELEDHNTEASDDDGDESPNFVDDASEDDIEEARDDNVLVELMENAKISSKDEEISIQSREQAVLSVKGKDAQVSSREEAPTSDNLVSQNCTPEPSKRRKARKSFFRMEGLVKRGKWKLGSKIGVGSFGTVHVGMNNQTGKLMAVKKFKVEDSIMQDVRREVELMRSLDHQNIVRYLGAQMDKTHLHIFQEWVPGGSVATLLGRFGPFTLQVIQSYLSQTLAGLAYLHENDIMHRDIKGSNILVNDEGIVKLADFGASKKLTNLKANLMMSLTVRGTPYFMSPEVFEEKYSAKADIWGIGCVAYQMITGSPPWKDKGFSNPISLFNHIKKHTGPPLIEDEHKERLSKEDKNIYSFMGDLLNCCFSKDPESRPDANDLLQHKFFTEMHKDLDDESVYSRGLFSPANAKTSSPASAQSPEGDSEIADTPSPSPLGLPAPTPPKSLARSKSVVQWRTTIATPPRPKQATNKNQPSPLYSSPYHSPEPDSSNWPDWARAEIQKRNLFEESPSSNPIPVKEENNLSVMMGSLALSEDSEAQSANPFGRASHGRISTIGTTEESKLAGLSLLNDSNITFEI